jgi:hypothetical protein
MHAYRLARLGQQALPLKLGEAVGGFFCRSCRQSVRVVIRALIPWV